MRGWSHGEVSCDTRGPLCCVCRVARALSLSLSLSHTHSSGRLVHGPCRNVLFAVYAVSLSLTLVGVFSMAYAGVPSLPRCHAATQVSRSNQQHRLSPSPAVLVLGVMHSQSTCSCACVRRCIKGRAAFLRRVLACIIKSYVYKGALRSSGMQTSTLPYHTLPYHTIPPCHARIRLVEVKQQTPLPVRDDCSSAMHNCGLLPLPLKS